MQVLQGHKSAAMSVTYPNILDITQSKEHSCSMVTNLKNLSYCVTLACLINGKATILGIQSNTCIITIDFRVKKDYIVLP